MHKKIESELVSIAHGILQMKNKDDVLALKEKAKDVFEKLSVLAFVDRYIETTPSATETKEDILAKVEAVGAIIVEESITDLSTDKSVEIKEEVIEEEEILVEEAMVDLTTEVLVEEKIEEIVEEAPISELVVEKEEESTPTEEKAVIEEIEFVKEYTDEDNSRVSEGLFSFEPEPVVEEKKVIKHTLEEELKDTIPVDVATDIFENAVRVETPRRSLNDVLIRSNIQIGLNDRIAFVKHLFDGSQEDFNRVVSQLNSFKSEKEARKFISKMVKPDYNWAGKEDYEERLISLITRKFA